MNEMTRRNVYFRHPQAGKFSSRRNYAGRGGISLLRWKFRRSSRQLHHRFFLPSRESERHKWPGSDLLITARVARYRINYDECALINYKSINVRPAKRTTNNTTGACPPRRTNTLLNTPLISHTRRWYLFAMRLRVPTSLSPIHYSRSSQRRRFFDAQHHAEFYIAVVPPIRRVNYPPIHPVQPLSFFLSARPTDRPLINVKFRTVAEGGHATRCGTRTPATNGGRSSGTRGYGWSWKSALESPSSSARVGQVVDFVLFTKIKMKDPNLVQ